MTHILVADDDPDILCLVEINLKSSGFDVTTVQGGQAALEELTARSFDLAILDVDMPGKDGIEVTVEIREGFSCRAMPIVLMSALDSDAQIKRGYDAGANDYVTKPFSSLGIGQRVEALLARSA